MSPRRHSSGSALARAGRRPTVLLALLCWCAGCAAPTPPAPAPAPATPTQERQSFSTFEDPAAAAAFEAALARLQEGDEAGALPLLQRAVELCPSHVLATIYYQDAALHLGGASEASMRGHFAAASDELPTVAYAKARLLGSNFLRKGAIDALLVRRPDFAYGHLSQGRLWRGIGRMQEAVQAFGRALALEPRLLEAYVEQADCLLELGRVPQALDAYENYLRAAPNDRVTARQYVHVLLYRAAEPQKAEPWIERLLAQDPQDEALRMDRAACHWRLGRFESALAGYLAVLQDRPDNARAALNIGCLHFDALARDDDARAVHWPKARAAFTLFLQIVRPLDGYDHFERTLAVPYRLKQIEAVCGPAPAQKVTLDQLR